jgi:hypothetical protein
VPHTLSIAFSLVAGAGCSGSGNGSSQTMPPWMTVEEPFVWDAGDASADGSLGCAIFDCEDSVASRCSADQTCVGESQMIMNPDAIVFDECLSDGSRVHIVQYGSSADSTLYQPDGGECLAIIGNEFQDPAGQPLATFASSGTDLTVTCGGLTMLDPICNDGRHRRGLLTLGTLTCLPSVPPCNP